MAEFMLLNLQKDVLNAYSYRKKSVNSKQNKNDKPVVLHKLIVLAEAVLYQVVTDQMYEVVVESNVDNHIAYLLCAKPAWAHAK